MLAALLTLLFIAFAPPVHSPADNPQTPEKATLGRHLFYDTRLSANGTQSCATCHRQELAFTDGKAHSIGSTGTQHPRSSMSLVNVAYSFLLTWNNPHPQSLEEQMLTPMYGQQPVELGMNSSAVAAMIKADATYRQLFASAFPQDPDPLSGANITKAIACFERTIISARSPYDSYHYGGHNEAVSPAARRGEVLFFSQPFACFRCHGGFSFGGGPDFHNNGLDATGKFRAPTLRNIALTAPYMHDGRLSSLEEVIDHYASGGKASPTRDELVQGFQLTIQQRADLIEFLRSLTDHELITDPRFSDPWKHSN